MYQLQSDIATADRPPIVLTVAQRKSNLKDKNRIKWADAKHLALVATDCRDTAEVRKWLKVLQINGKLNLRLTTAWISVRIDLAHIIKFERSNILRIDNYRSKPKAKTAIDILYEAMLDAIAYQNWEMLRPCLDKSLNHKSAAWALLTDDEKKQLENITPMEIKALKRAEKEGKIAAYKELDLGGMFLVWYEGQVEPELLTGTVVTNKWKT